MTRTGALLLTLCLTGCPDATSPAPDASPDAHDAAVEMGADLPLDAPAEAQLVDRGRETAADGPEHDLPPPLPKRTITLAVGPSTGAMTLETWSTDGSGSSKIAGFGALDLGQTTYLRGRVNQYFPFSRDIPQEERRLSYSPIYLPRGLGYLKWYCDTTASKAGLMVLRPGGSVEVLYAATGGCKALSNFVAVSADGELAATHRPGVGVVVVRTDKTTFSGGKSYLELDPPTAGYIYPESVTLAGQHVLFVSRAGAFDSQHTLWRAALGGAGKPAAVALPKVGGLSPTWIDDEIAFAEQGTLALVTAGAYTSTTASTKEDVIAVDVASGAAVNLSGKPGDYGPRFFSRGFSGAGCQLEASPSGTSAAYVHKASSTVSHLWVAATGGSAAPVQVTSAANVTAAEIQVNNLLFVDDDNLLFTAHRTSFAAADIFRFHLPSKTLTNVTRSGGGAKAPHALQGAIAVRGIWRSPGRQYLYYVHDATQAASKTAEIVAIDLASFKTKPITKGAEVAFGYDAFGACAKGATMFFAAEPKASSGHRLELFSFDMDQATPALQLTSITAKTYGADNFIYGINPSSDCSHVAFRAGKYGHQDLYVARASAPVSVTNVSNASASGPSGWMFHYVGEHHLFAPDSALVVYHAGAWTTRLSMYVAPVKWQAQPKTLFQASPAYPKHWQLFAVW